MSRCDDKWLDICTLLRGIEDDGEIVIMPTRNNGSTRILSFTVTKPTVSGDTTELILDVLNLADSFEFFVSNDRLTVIVRVNVFKS